jgi:hypothetical protein
MLWRLCDFGIGRIFDHRWPRPSAAPASSSSPKPSSKKIDNKARVISFGLASVPAKQASTKPVIDAVQAYLLARPVVSGDDNRTGGSL